MNREMVNRVAEELKPLMPESIEVSCMDVNKLNGNSYYGIGFRKHDDSMRAVLNIQSYLEDDSKSHAEMLEEIKEAALTALQHGIMTDIDRCRTLLEDYDYIKHHLILRTVGLQKNLEMLKDKVYDPHLDLAAVYEVTLGDGRGAVLTKDAIAHLGVSEEQLKIDAECYSLSLDNITIEPIEKCLSRLMDEEIPVSGDLYVARLNEDGRGAGCMFYPGFFRKALDIFGEAFFILPSSIDEILLLKRRKNVDVYELREMVKEINFNEVRPEEQLSNSVYMVDENCEISIV